MGELLVLQMGNSASVRTSSAETPSESAVVVEFETELTGFVGGETAAYLSGKLKDGTVINGSDSVNVKSPGK